MTLALGAYAVFLMFVAGSGWGRVIALQRRLAQATREAWEHALHARQLQAAFDTEKRKRAEAEAALEREIATRRADTAGWRRP